MWVIVCFCGEGSEAAPDARCSLPVSVGKVDSMAGKKGYVLRVSGADEQLFENTFCAYVQTGKEASDGIVSDYRGTVDRDGRFFITRKGKDVSKGLNNEAHLMGTVHTDREKNETVIEYVVRMSAVFLACMVILGLLCAGFLTYALIVYFQAGQTGPLLPSSFFTIGFLVVLVISLVRPDCRALEKVLEKIIGEYADVVCPDTDAQNAEGAESSAETAENGEQTEKKE